MIEIDQLSIQQLQKDLPQLIVALDTLNDSSNYIHIADAQDNVIYYCPCCKGIIKPRAFKTDIKYQVQPHYYHENGGCNEESFVHYICKTWLFEKGSKFKINNIIYTVSNIETEMSLHTEFGYYRPDIIVYTDENKTFFFEIKYSNKKTEHYIPKWDELGNDVIEVDARYFINQKYVNDIPEFKLIYSDGECYIKTYTKSDYDDFIAKRKLEWKRQDKLNYKMMWERLDWFWIKVQDVKSNSANAKKLMSAFINLPDSDKEMCFEIIKKMSCLKVYNDDFRYIVNSYLKAKFTKYYVQNLLDDDVVVNNIYFKEREYVSIDCTYKPNTLDWDASEDYYSKEWIFRYSKIIKLIDEINITTEIYKNREKKNEELKKLIKPIIKKISNRIKNTSWEFCINEIQYNHIEDYTISIGIKNGYKINHTKKFCFRCDNFEKIECHAVESYIVEKLIVLMNEIKDYIMLYDGIGCEYRHVFIGGINR